MSAKLLRSLMLCLSRSLLLDTKQSAEEHTKNTKVFCAAKLSSFSGFSLLLFIQLKVQEVRQLLRHNSKQYAHTAHHHTTQRESMHKTR